MSISRVCRQANPLWHQSYCPGAHLVCMSRFGELDSVLLEYTQDKIALIDSEGIFR